MKKTTILVTVLVLGALLLSGAGTVFAATTGKITGVIKDRSTNAPLVGTNVMVEGTGMGAVTEADGNFTIINCPPGVHTLRVTMMGFKKTVVRNVRVSIDLTTTIDVDMEPTVIEGETVNIVSERPLVRKDMTGSLAVVGADEIKNLPVDNIQNVLSLKAGVTTESDGTVHIRGGRGGEVAYWVDGVPMTTSSGRNMGITVENAAVQELQVVSGTFNAEYGKAMSGIINIVTKEGEEKYSGSVTGYAEGYSSGDKTFANLKRVDVVDDPTAIIGKRAVGMYEYPIKGLKLGTYDIQPVLSGPVPFTHNKLTFFANARIRSSGGWEYGRRWWTPIGWPGDSSQVRLNGGTNNTFMGKLSYRLNPHISVKYQLLFDNGSGSNVTRQYTYTPDARTHWRSERWTHMFLLNHVLSPKTFYELRVARYYSAYRSFPLGDVYAACKYNVKVYADTSRGLLEDIFDPIANPEKLEEAKNLRRSYTYITQRDSPMGYMKPDSVGVPVNASFNRAGWPSTSYYWNRENYWLGKLDLTSQVNRVHQIKAGLEAKISRLFTDQFSVVSKFITGSSGNLEEVVPYQPDVPGDTTVNRNTYLRKPDEFSAYLQDKIEVKDLIVNIGVRFDYFNSNSYIPSDPSDPNIYFPMRPENRYVNYVPPDPTLSAPEREAYMKQFSLYTPEQRRALMQQKADPVYAVSPRIGLSYPITDRGIIHFCYGHFFAMPDMSLLYQNPDFKFPESGGLNSFGNPALKPERTVQYEIGLQQQLSQDFGFDVSLFYKDIRDWTGSGPRIQTVLPSITYSMMENKDYANVRGVTFSLTKRQSNYFSASLDYTFQYAEGTYTNPTDAYIALQNNQAKRLTLIPLGYDQRHTLNANVTLLYRSWSATLLGQYHTGNPYTPTLRNAESMGSGAGSIPENSEFTPSVKNVDMYIEKLFTVGRMRLGLFARIYNLFDFRNELGVFTDTGSASYTTTIDPAKQPYDAKRVGTVEEQIRNPYFFSGPRRIQAGMSVGF